MTDSELEILGNFKYKVYINSSTSGSDILSWLVEHFGPALSIDLLRMSSNSNKGSILKRNWLLELTINPKICYKVQFKNIDDWILFKLTWT